jgi:hypothetical protein
VGPRAGLDAVVKRKIPSPCRDSNPIYVVKSVRLSPAPMVMRTVCVFYGCKTWFLILRVELRLRLGAEENIWTYERGGNKRMEKIAQ